jgi:hypothetical protein
MVRLKTRWLLVRLDVGATVSMISRSRTNKNTNENTTSSRMDDEDVVKLFPSRKDLATALRQNISAHMGISGEGAALNTQGKEESIGEIMLI